MNPQGGGANQVNGRNTNNQNSTSHSSLESLQITLLPLFPVTTIRERFLGGIAQPNINLPQQGLTSVPPHESPNLALGSNISSSSSIARTPQNPSNNLDLSLTIGLAHQGHEVQEQSVHGGNSSNSNVLPRSINSTTHASGRFLRGESSNVREQGPPAKRQVIEFNVGGNNNFNLSLPPPRRQVPQLLSANPRIGPIQGHDHVNPHNVARSTPQPQHNLHVNRIENNFRRGAQGQLQRYYLSSSGSSHHNPQPHPNLHRPSMTSLPSVINVSTHQVFAPPYHQTLGDIRAPLQGHINFQGGNMLGHISHQAIMYHPLSQQVGPSAFGSSHGTQEMNHTIGASTSRNQNYHNEFVIPTLQPRVNREIVLPQESSTIDMRRRLLTEIQYLLNQPMDQSTPMLEEMMLTDYSSLMLLEHGTTFQGQLNPPHLGLSVETIMGHIRRENFMSSVDTENPDDEEKCVICLEVYEDGDEIGKLDLCVHKFHVQCIKQWLMQRNVCPICKRIGLTINNAENEVGAVVNNENANA